MAIILLVYSSLLIEARKVKLQIKRHVRRELPRRAAPPCCAAEPSRRATKPLCRVAEPSRRAQQPSCGGNDKKKT
jgi:hypothetical protein